MDPSKTICEEEKTALMIGSGEVDVKIWRAKTHSPLEMSHNRAPDLHLRPFLLRGSFVTTARLWYTPIWGLHAGLQGEQLLPGLPGLPGSIRVDTTVTDGHRQEKSLKLFWSYEGSLSPETMSAPQWVIYKTLFTMHAYSMLIWQIWKVL